MRHIRTAARALIILDQKVLSIKMCDKTGIFYILPGGGQRHGESLTDTLIRECLEEIGTNVEVGELAYVREYIGKNHEFNQMHHTFHQVENVFHCSLTKPQEIDFDTQSDKKQIGVEWIRLEDLPMLRFLPKTIKPFFKDGKFVTCRKYLGDVN